MPSPCRDTVLTLGKPSGEQTTEQVGDETLVRFQFNDRGRGPEISARWHLDAAGIPTAMRIEGKSYLKTPVDERFERAADGKASWHNENEQGERANAPGAFYIPVNSPPALYAALVEALARAPGQKLPLLPAGEARLERVDERKVTLADGSWACDRPLRDPWPGLHADSRVARRRRPVLRCRDLLLLDRAQRR